MDTEIANSKATKSNAAKPASSITFSLSLLAFIIFVIVSTEFIVLGLLPTMAENLNIPLADAGWFVTCFALSASLLGPPLTVIVSRYNRHNFLIASALAFAIGNLLIASVQNYYLIIVVRIIQGGILPAIISMVALEAIRLAGAEREGWAISRVNLGIAATTILGIPGAAIVADKMGWSASFALLALLGLISAVLIKLWCPSGATKNTRQTDMLASISLLWHPFFLTHLLLSCVLFTGMFAGFTYIAALLKNVAKFDASVIAWVLMGFGLAGLVGNWLCGRVVDRSPVATTAWVALVLTFAMVAIAPIAPSLYGLIFIVGLWGAAHMAAFIVSQIRVMKAGQGAEALALSLNISASNLGIGFGSTIGGSVVTHYGVETVGYAGAVIVAVALFIAILMILTRPRGFHRVKKI